MAANSVLARIRDEAKAKSLSTRSLKRAMCAEYVRDFDIERVAEMFATDEDVVRRVVNSPDMQRHLERTLGDVSSMDKIAARRLLEALLEEAFADADDKEKRRARTEARKILARHYLPKRTESTNTHRYFIETPAKLEADDWQSKYGALPKPSIDETEDEIEEAEYEVVDE